MKALSFTNSPIRECLPNRRPPILLRIIAFAVIASLILPATNASAQTTQPKLKDQTLLIAATTFPWAKMELKSHVSGTAMPGTLDIKLFEPRSTAAVRNFKCSIVARACTGPEKIFDVVGKDSSGHILMKLTSNGFVITELTVSSFSCSIDFCQTASALGGNAPPAASMQSPDPDPDTDSKTETGDTKTWNEILLSNDLRELLKNELLEITLTAKGDTTEISFSLKTAKLLELLQKSQDDTPELMQQPSPDPDCPPCYGHDDVPVTVEPEDPVNPVDPNDPQPGPSPGPTPDPDQS